MSDQQSRDKHENEEQKWIDLERCAFNNVPAALVLTDLNQTITWCNPQFCRWSHSDDSVGQRFFSVLGRPALRGPDFLPFSMVKRTGNDSMTVLEMDKTEKTSTKKANDPHYLSMEVGPVLDKEGKVTGFAVSLHDVSEQIMREERWLRLLDAGRELADLSKKDVLRRSPKERSNILRAKIAKCVQEILRFPYVEIRIKSEKAPIQLKPLFSFGFPDDSRNRTIYVNQDGNGVTGWVAYHAKSYKMDDSNEDPFFIEGITGSRSSMTVPLLCRGEVIGTVNVESLEPNVFDENDLKLLEVFADNVALAIHTLELLSIEQKETAFRSIEKVFSDSIGPLNLILNETTFFPLEELQQATEAINLENVVTSFAKVREYTRQIQSAFQEHINSLSPELPTELSATDCNNYPMLRNCRILMVDSDESVGRELSRMLFYYGCTVETSTLGFGALKMLETTRYHAVISDISLPDMSAFTFFKLVRCIYCKRFQNRPLAMICMPPEEDPCCPSAAVQPIPFVFMKGYGHDKAHVTTQAALAGANKVIYKPFILIQLLETLKMVILKSGQNAC